MGRDNQIFRVLRLKTEQFVTPRATRSGLRVLPHVQAGRCPGERAGFTLVEVLISAAIVALIFGAVINSYVQAGRRIEWTGYSLAAQSLAVQIVEQAKAANWDPALSVNNLTNLNLQGATYTNSTLTYAGHTTGILDVPYSDTNSVVATSYVTVQMINVGGHTNVQTQFIRVDTVWPFPARGTNVFFTNTLCTMVAPDMN
jgi:prepilin-type N-terminal cleavage/methylation domain-containing protein